MLKQKVETSLTQRQSAILMRKYNSIISLFVCFFLKASPLLHQPGPDSNFNHHVSEKVISFGVLQRSFVLFLSLLSFQNLFKCISRCDVGCHY